jgi:murein DD-endopeptidase MepM/ murein hydrolase activator NlpD
MKNPFRLPLFGALLLLVSCASPAAGFGMPLEKTPSRPQLLTFGLFVTSDPAHNPIDPPERFEGFHAALDFEILPGEEATDTPVFAICDGTVRVSEFAEGYGGVLVQSCMLEGQDINVLYGHLNLDSMAKAGTEVKKGDRIALLGAPRSHDTDGNRKHLHLGIHRGKEVVLLGYVQTAQELSAFIDPAQVLGLPTHPWPSSASDAKTGSGDLR